MTQTEDLNSFFNPQGSKPDYVEASRNIGSECVFMDDRFWSSLWCVSVVHLKTERWHNSHTIILSRIIYRNIPVQWLWFMINLLADAWNYPCRRLLCFLYLYLNSGLSFDRSLTYTYLAHPHQGKWGLADSDDLHWCQELLWWSLVSWLTEYIKSFWDCNEDKFITGSCKLLIYKENILWQWHFEIGTFKVGSNTSYNYRTT